MTNVGDLSYPVGKFDKSAPVSPDMRRPAVDVLAGLPAKLREAVRGLNDAQVDTPYRPGGWTVRQLVHHIADSHMNGYIRTKLALTEDTPTIKPYVQDAWATLADSALPIDLSLGIVDGVHARWSAVCGAMTPDQFSRTFRHPDLGLLTLDTHIQLYAWHSRHHLAHIVNLREREGWTG